MKKIIKLFVVAAVIALTTITTIAQTSTRLDALERPKVQTWSSNSTTASVDFTPGIFGGTNGIVTAASTYEVKNLNGNITLYLTNLVAGVERSVFIGTDGSSRTVAIVTNGLETATRISYAILPVNTNGATAYTITNRAVLNLICRPAGEVSVSVTHFR